MVKGFIRALTGGREGKPRTSATMTFLDALMAANACSVLCDAYAQKSHELVALARYSGVKSKEIAEAERLAAAHLVMFKSWSQLAHDHEESLELFRDDSRIDKALRAQLSEELLKRAAQVGELRSSIDAALPTVDMLEVELPGLISMELQVQTERERNPER